MMQKYVIAILFSLALPAFAAAAPAGNDSDVPPGTEGSGLITLEQMTEELQFFRIEQEDIFVHFVLPKGWELVEEGIDPATGKVLENSPAYTLLSRAPSHGNEATDFIFELDIFHQGLTEELPADTPADERNPGVQMWNFLNQRISMYLRGGLTLHTQRNQIEAKAYGTTSPQREPTFFVPLAYDVPASGAQLYTFTTFTGDTVWEIKCLVSEGQIENYGALIALILDNSFGLTEAQLKEAQAKGKTK